MPKTQSPFIYRKHIDATPHGLVNVYDRETGEHAGQLNPVHGGGYILRDRAGRRLDDITDGRLPGWTPLSREPAARTLRTNMRLLDAILELRAGTVTEGCPNTWHNTSDYRATAQCPECPTQAGSK
jgi:hypothetical protein